MEKLPGVAGWYRERGNGRAVWHENGDLLLRWGMASSADAKAAFQLRSNVTAFISYWGRKHCLFFTVTDDSGLHPSQFACRWNSFLVRNAVWIRSYIRVLEPQRNGRPHYHVLMAVPWDTQPERFDWVAFEECQRERVASGHTARFRDLRRQYKESAAPELVDLWSLLRKVLPRYGLGRAEILPIRKAGEAVSEYIGKYLEAGLVLRRHSWKGCRRVEYDRREKVLWQACSRIFAWNSPGAKTWRRRLGELAAVLGLPNMDALRSLAGPKWAYHLREAITLSSDEEWRQICSCIRPSDLTSWNLTDSLHAWE